MHHIRNNDTDSSYLDHFIENKPDTWILRFLYQNQIGRVFLKFATSSFVTRNMGRFYDSKYSKKLISGFIEKNHIDKKEFKSKKYTSFNDFFTREKKVITFSQKNSLFCSPCDGYLSAYQIEEDRTFQIKHISYTLDSLLQNHSFAKKFQGGYIYIFRLMPEHYHRFHYFDDGKKIYQKEIPGCFHTVRPVALEKRKVFIENERTYTLMETKNFGDVVMMEVGALGVGKIKNYDKRDFKRGEEKGMFLFGGSTIIVLFQKDVLAKNDKLLKYSLDNYEAVVKCGCIVGEKK